MDATRARQLRVYHKRGIYRVCKVQGQRIFKYLIMQIYFEYTSEVKINIIKDLIIFSR